MNMYLATDTHMKMFHARGHNTLFVVLRCFIDMNQHCNILHWPLGNNILTVKIGKAVRVTMI